MNILYLISNESAGGELKHKTTYVIPVFTSQLLTKIGGSGGKYKHAILEAMLTPPKQKTLRMGKYENTMHE